MPPFDYFPDTMDYRQVVSIHLSGNFYPPLPQDYVEPAVQARDLCADGDYDATVVIPFGVNPAPRDAVEKEDGWHIGAARLLDILRLDIPDDAWED